MCSFVCSDALDSIERSSPLLNLPAFLQLDVSSKRDSDKLYDAIQHLTVADYAKREIMHYLCRISYEHASPIEVMGALSQWPVAPGKEDRSLSLFVNGLRFLDETAWAKTLAREPRLLLNSMANLTCIQLSMECPRPQQNLAIQLDTAGEKHRELTQGRRWCALLQAAVNLKSLILDNESEWSAGFDNLLHLIFSDDTDTDTATWPQLTELSIRRDRNVGLLPLSHHLFPHSLGWYVFLQRDLDRFLVRHKKTLQKLILRNILGLTERVPLAPLSWQWLQPGFPQDPKPSLCAFGQSLKLWKRELKALTKADVYVALEFNGIRRTAVGKWLEESEVQALASTMDVRATWHNIPVDVGLAEPSVVDCWRGSSHVEFGWGDWLLGEELGVV